MLLVSGAVAALEPDLPDLAGRWSRIHGDTAAFAYEPVGTVLDGTRAATFQRSRSASQHRPGHPGGSPAAPADRPCPAWRCPAAQGRAGVLRRPPGPTRRWQHRQRTQTDRALQCEAKHVSDLFGVVDHQHPDRWAALRPVAPYVRRSDQPYRPRFTLLRLTSRPRPLLCEALLVRPHRGGFNPVTPRSPSGVTQPRRASRSGPARAEQDRESLRRGQTNRSMTMPVACPVTVRCSRATNR